MRERAAGDEAIRAAAKADCIFCRIVAGTIPFHLIMFALLGLLVLLPDIAMWLPSRAAAVP